MSLSPSPSSPPPPPPSLVSSSGRSGGDVRPRKRSRRHYHQQQQPPLAGGSGGGNNNMAAPDVVSDSESSAGSRPRRHHHRRRHKRHKHKRSRHRHAKQTKRRGREEEEEGSHALSMADLEGRPERLAAADGEVSSESEAEAPQAARRRRRGGGGGVAVVAAAPVFQKAARAAALSSSSSPSQKQRQAGSGAAAPATATAAAKFYHHLGAFNVLRHTQVAPLTRCIVPVAALQAVLEVLCAWDAKTCAIWFLRDEHHRCNALVRPAGAAAATRHDVFDTCDQPARWVLMDGQHVCDEHAPPEGDPLREGLSEQQVTFSGIEFHHVSDDCTVQVRARLTGIVPVLGDDESWSCGDVEPHTFLAQVKAAKKLMAVRSTQVEVTIGTSVVIAGKQDTLSLHVSPQERKAGAATLQDLDIAVQAMVFGDATGVPRPPQPSLPADIQFHFNAMQLHTHAKAFFPDEKDKLVLDMQELEQRHAFPSDVGKMIQPGEQVGVMLVSPFDGSVATGVNISGNTSAASLTFLAKPFFSMTKQVGGRNNAAHSHLAAQAQWQAGERVVVRRDNARLLRALERDNGRRQCLFSKRLKAILFSARSLHRLAASVKCLGQQDAAVFTNGTLAGELNYYSPLGNNIGFVLVSMGVATDELPQETEEEVLVKMNAATAAARGNDPAAAASSGAGAGAGVSTSGRTSPRRASAVAAAFEAADATLSSSDDEDEAEAAGGSDHHHVAAAAHGDGPSPTSAST